MSTHSAYLRIAQLASTAKQPGYLPMSSATIWRKVAANEFPKPTKLGPRITAWAVADVDAWLEKQRGESA